MTTIPSESLTCPPAWGTRRNPARPTWGPHVGKVAARLGRPFMPWQQHVMDVALEIDPATGFLWYREVDVYVPRQSGKTTLNLPRVVWRAETAKHLGGRQVMLYTAQTGKDALAKWQEDYLEDLQAAPVMRWGRPDARAREILASGRQRIRFRNGSTFAPIAGTSTGGHGKTLDDGTIDEFWSATSNEIQEGWRPAMITRRWAQVWKESTAGTAKSLPLRAAVQSGRALVESGRVSRRAYFEWTLPAEYDPTDPASWALCMPALGYTQPIEAIEHELQSMLDDPELGLPAFRRAYCNQWSDEFDDTEWIIPKASWSACGDDETRRADGSPPALAVDTAPNRSHSSIVMSADREDGLPMVQVVRHGDGASWLPEHVGRLARDKGATVVVVDRASPAHNYVEAIRDELAGVCDVWETTAGEYADACSAFYDAAVTEQLRHADQPELTTALASADWRTMAGGRRAYDVRASGSDITPLVGATLALAGHTRYPGRDDILY